MSENPLKDIRHITVIGAGAMGSQIAMVCALAGYDTDVVDIKQEAVDKASEQLHSRMDRDVSKGRRTQQDVDAAFERLTFSTDRDACAAQADFVIEAAVEDLTIKRQVFAELDAVCPEHTILATNSSNIVSSRVADATNRPEKVCNVHFFNPALVMKCVEVVPHQGTSRETVETAMELARSIGKAPVELKKEVPGFVANRLLGALRSEALKLYEDGVADYKDIDVAAKTALNHPMGPFELMDMVGIDVVYLIRLAEYEQTGDPASLPAESIKEKYEAGDYGRKTGKGWYDYE
ncbi:3-hydroxyacyl-CoA dehydrogenase family protein [Kocuria rhizophila]|uniref:3-hydroxyacyl-CoA dehydrogenase family protein n=1 Tax=Kocuria TaxID=57493 RepID=UPI0009F6700A|nr:MULTISPECIES: 3-hydroxyacyl-CoA dehydrogenase family protein [Kocuria]MBO4145767.1 3-hydroxyacyl-CoA dehydrogenase family protein [Kocuria rhizophila]MDN3225524.1 3-hydroxyacyl-CoA dehydrogenase family protein [Kocuria rhizophila]PKZ38482.1 3-hydroxyacyl-CoA dehydrogenase [Kocuria rhizophila]QTK32006.1 3-hydroxyacyl-CoA dehydrogenase family protein [Kocuria rhizophila]